MIRSLLLVLTLMYGCASYPHYKWSNSQPIVLKSVDWQVVDYSVVAYMCRDSKLERNEYFLACAVADYYGQCKVYSVLTEMQARWKMDYNGESVYHHELRHCKGETHARPDSRD